MVDKALAKLVGNQEGAIPMVTAHEVGKLATRLAKAEVLVHDGAIFPVAGLDGYAVVRNGHGTQMYLVRFEASPASTSWRRSEHLGTPLRRTRLPPSETAEGRTGQRRSLALLNGQLEEMARLERELAEISDAA
jgi:hypothetical protein